MMLRAIALSAAVLAASVCLNGAVRAQEFVYQGSSAKAPTVEQYLDQIGPDGKEVPHREYKIDGHTV